MKIKALTSFTGVLTMARGDVLEYGDQAVLQDLLQAGYIAEIKEVAKSEAVPAKKKVKAGESK